MVKVKTDEYQLGALVKPLCLWYEENKRSMPWRDAPTPYHVWVSEIMLQQTRIEAAKAYYERFLKRIPDIATLADIQEEELLKLWEGLGYYNRARNLQKAAKVIMSQYNGELPDQYEQLLNLPGIGNYTAGAIASIAYGVPAPAVDGNVLRVSMRFLGCSDDIMKQSVRKKMEQAVMNVIPKEKPGTFNQALMELGEVVCIPNGAPLCEKCPLSSVCQAHKKGREMELPVKEKKKQRRIEKRTILVFRYNGKLGIVKRPKKGLLAGMWEFPGLEEEKTPARLKQWMTEMSMPDCRIYPLEDSKHIFSHVEWHMKGYLIELESPLTYRPQDVVWVEYEKLQDEYAIPVAFHKFLSQLK